jgi:hypothetical protein
MSAVTRHGGQSKWVGTRKHLAMSFQSRNMRRADAHKSGHPFVTVVVVRLGCIEEILESNVIETFLKKNNVQQDV